MCIQLRLCPLFKDTPPDFLNLLMILCTVDGGIEVFAILHWETPSHVTDLLPGNFISCQMLLHLFFLFAPITCPIIVVPVPTFLRRVAAIKVQTRWYFPLNGKMSQLQHLLCSLCSTGIKIWVANMRFANHCVLFLFTFYTESQLFGIGFVNHSFAKIWQSNIYCTCLTCKCYIWSFWDLNVRRERMFTMIL